MRAGATSNVASLQTVLVQSPRDAWRTQDQVATEWQALHYTHEPDLARAIAQHETLVALLSGAGCEVHRLGPDGATGLDSIYVHDPVVMAGRGAILCRMGKAARRGEPAALGRWLADAGVAIVGQIEPPGTLEGGDVVWLDGRTVAVGEGYRSNAEGIRQFRALLNGEVDQVLAVPLPHWTGPADVLHLMSLLSPVDLRTAVVYSRLLPVPFRSLLLQRGWRLIEVPDEEYDGMACNLLPLAPADCIMLDGCPVTQGRLEAAGIRVQTYPGSDISLPGGGGPTCLTRPLLRGSR